jgi:hypothetical protein
MKFIALDFETYYDKSSFTLKKMTPVQYVLDPRFESIGCAVKEGLNATSYWVEGPDLPKYFAQADKNAGYITFNALFDMCITSWRYDWRPRLMVDAMGMFRACYGHQLRSVSLKTAMEFLGLGAKGTTVDDVSGYTLAMLKAQPELYERYKSYSCNDADGAYGVFDILLRRDKLFPISELAVMDMVLRCALQPRFRLDQMVLAEHLNQVKADKAQLLAMAGLQADADGKAPELQSNDQFAALLQNLGVDPPRKVSLKTNKETWAFSKQDPEFIALADDDDPAVQALVGARLGHKSTLEETRTQRLLDISRLHWPDKGQAAYMPIPLKFSGAIQTHRLSGDWKLNMQNLPRNTPARQSPLRRALVAEDGELVVVGDMAQIEARIVAWICNQLELLSQFENNEDVYALFASLIFGFPVNKNDHAPQRFIGKTGILGLGFGVGWVKFQRTVKLDSRKFTGESIILTDEEAHGVVDKYRTRYHEIPDTWKSLNADGIAALANGHDYKIGPCEFEKETVHLPNGLRLHYHDLRYENDEWWFTSGVKRKKLYGGSLLENIVQALARIITMDAGVRIQKRIREYDCWLNLQGHDELAYVVPQECGALIKAIIKEEMPKRPWWAKDLPLKTEIEQGASYADAK